jgi:hypothetical protein
MGLLPELGFFVTVQSSTFAVRKLRSEVRQSFQAKILELAKSLLAKRLSNEKRVKKIGKESAGMAAALETIIRVRKSSAADRCWREVCLCTQKTKARFPSSEGVYHLLGIFAKCESELSLVWSSETCS